MSVQLDTYLASRARGDSVERACELSTIGHAEALLHEEDIASGALELPHVHVHAREGQSQEKSMARDSETTTTIRIGDGPEIPIDLDNIDNPDNADAKAALGEFVGEAIGKPATAAGENLKRYIERAERLDAEIKDLNADKSELFKEAKSNGFDTATMKRIIKLRKMEPHHRQEAEALLQTYMDAIGMTPIEQAIALAP